MRLGPENWAIASRALDPNKNTQCIYRGPIKQWGFVARRGASLGGALPARVRLTSDEAQVTRAPRATCVTSTHQATFKRSNERGNILGGTIDKASREGGLRF